ncbi:S8 family peptidase [Oscillochloris sp. ZM17-4]|uniref:S8 family peptidase n=1 Tax=Oscillochloris sp. ZM17-4 TaxID=2866714 RepID=UPI001C72AB00|nr:S8 family peptidase [Oscillochloris sp. ZM17-4]MBX0328131.1 S8 family peptidase [Oscillochloris sp. ZM17-4]
MNRTHLSTAFSLFAALVLLTCSSPATPNAAAAAAYVDPALAAQTVGQVSVIVSGSNVAQAVEAAGGTVTDDLWLIDAVAADVPASAVRALASAPGIVSVVLNYGVTSSDWDGWVTDLPLPSVWDGRPDVQATSDPKVWNVVNPVPIDIGADTLHSTLLRSGKPIRGDGVTVALVDSGIYFDKQVRATLGSVVAKQFVGQADFVDDTCATVTKQRGKTELVGTQGNGYCWLSHTNTADGYGHGTAVASIIWNNFTDSNTGVTLGVAPAADILSVRVLGDDGTGTYATVIKGIQYVVKNSNRYGVKVLNLSISASVSVPYFVDPLNRAVEQAWARDIVVIAAAGNNGSAPGSVTVPGNDPYVITVGAVDEHRTPGYWADDTIPDWSAAGPTGDGFVKPDIIAPGVNIITFMYKDPQDPTQSQQIVQIHPDSAVTTSLFRMSGTSMSAAVASGVAALTLQANPKLTPDQVKYRLMASARPAVVGEPAELVYPVFRQGMGRIWAPDAVLGTFKSKDAANAGMNIKADLKHGFLSDRDLTFHYQGPVHMAQSDDGTAQLYYIGFADGRSLGLGAWSGQDGWLNEEILASRKLVWVIGGAPLGDSDLAWVGGTPLSTDATVDASRKLVWVISRMIWDGEATWLDGELSGQAVTSIEPSRRLVWVIGRTEWDGGTTWADAVIEPSRRLVWVITMDPNAATITTTSWVQTP